MAGKPGKLYPRSPEARERVEKEFVERYGPEKGPEVYGATVGKVRAEQAAEGERGRRVWIRPHKAVSDEGTAFRVEGHWQDVPRLAHDPTHSHGPGHHAGCRRGGRCFHTHRTRRRPRKRPRSRRSFG
jgi:hypothetical protein